MESQEFTLPAGTVCTRNGIPFELAADTAIRCHPSNWALMNAEINQCDGCRRGLQMIDGVHRGPNSWDVQACTADRYGYP